MHGGETVRYAIVAIFVLLVVAALAGIKGAQIATLMSAGRKAQESGPPPEAVGVATATKQSWQASIDAVGSVASSKGVQVSNEVPGVVVRIAFESGEHAKKGDVLVELDADVERADLSSAVAAQALADVVARRTRALERRQAAAEEERDRAESELASATAKVTSLRAQVGRKLVRAPFSGRLGIRAVNLGQYLSPGTSITTLDAIDSVFVDFTVPQQRLADVSEGMPVRVSLQAKQLPGSIAAMDPSVDPTTRAVRLRATVPNAEEKLRPGMFVDVTVVLPKKTSYVTVPATAIVHAPYGDSVFVVEDKMPDEPGMRQTPDGKPVKAARQRFVRIGPRRGDFVAILQGVQANERVVMAGAFKLRNGSPVFISDVALPRPELEPRPQNR